MIPQIFRKHFPGLLPLVAVLSLSGCLGTFPKSFKVPNQPIAVHSISRPVDDENLDFLVSFRNTGGQVLSFDYTIADRPGVPHIDAGGPNSGLIENLYPGAEIEVKNPYKTTDIFVVPGTFTFGKMNSDQIGKIYNLPAKSAGADAAMVIPEI